MPALNDHPKYVTAKQAASIVGKTQATIYNWRKRGHFDVHHTDEKGRAMYVLDLVLAAAEGKPRPTVEHGDDGEIEVTQAAAAAEPERIPDINAERALHEKAKRIKAELDLEQRAGSLVSTDAATRAWENVAAVVRDRVMGIIPRVAPVVAALDDTRDVKATLDEALREALTVLRQPEVKR